MVQVTRTPQEATVVVDPDDLINLKQDVEIDRVRLVLGDETIALMQRFRVPGATPVDEYAGKAPIPDLTENEIDEFIAAVTEQRDPRDPSALRARIEDALNRSVDRCARCKVCDAQVDAVMAALGYPPENIN